MAMTLGKDVSALFPDVLKNIATSDLEQKKLVYLYLMWVPPYNSRWLRMLIGRISLSGTTPNRTLIYVFSP